MKNAKNLALHAAAITLPLALAACGGSGDTTQPATSPSLALGGTAATGAAIAGGTVTVKCAAGASTTATTGSDGRYALGVSSGALPCVLRVTSSDGGTSLYSVAAGSGSSATANITPLTHLVVASLGGTDPATLYTGFGSSSAAAVTAGAVAQAQASVVTTLASAGIDASAGKVGDLVTGTLTPDTSTTAGNAYAAALDTLQATLASTKDGSGNAMTLATLTTAVAAASPAAPAPAATAKASLPADLLLKPAAATCPALRSGSYRVVKPTAGATLAAQTGIATIDATTLAVVYPDGSAGQLTAHATQACRFTDETGLSDLVVSQSGVVALRSYDAGTARYVPAIAFPEQTHTLAELAGAWNTLGLQYAGSSAYIGTTVSGTFSAAGTVSGVSSCGDAGDWNVATCSPVTSGLPSFQVDAAGGFDAFGAGSSTPDSRTFAYRSGSGDLMMVNVDGDGSFEVRTPAQAAATPVVGHVSTNWDLRYSNALLATPALTESTSTVQSVDAAGTSYTRLAQTVGGTDQHVETVQLDDPRTGYNFRAAATVTGTDGTTVVNVSEWTNLPVRGMGFSALLRPAQKQFMFSVQQP